MLFDSFHAEEFIDQGMEDVSFGQLKDIEIPGLFRL